MGTYNPLNASSACLPCPVNTLGTTRGAASLQECEPCPEGFYNEEEGSTECAPTPTLTLTSNLEP